MLDWRNYKYKSESSEILILILLFGACSKPKIVNKSLKQKIDGIYFSDLEHEDIGYDISVEAPKLFLVDDNISFKIDTKEKIGYLYMLYIDLNGTVSRLFPHKNMPPFEKSEIIDVQNNLNYRPRKSLGFKTPAEVFYGTILKLQGFT